MIELAALKRNSLDQVERREASERVRFEAGLDAATRAARGRIEAASTESEVYRAIADYTASLASLRGTPLAEARGHG